MGGGGVCVVGLGTGARDHSFCTVLELISWTEKSVCICQRSDCIERNMVSGVGF